MRNQEEVLEYWLDIVGSERWYATDPALDADIAERFHDTWQCASRGELRDWSTDPRGALAFIIVTDQFSRNMFRDDARAFATDRLARAAAERALQRGWDLRIAEPERQFFYMPLMHSECPSDQDRCVRMIHARMPETGQDNLLHARVHREVIRRFGRFPHRNAALGRDSTDAEADFLAEGGYGGLVRDLQAA